MNKSQFLKSFAPKSKEIDIDGNKVTVNELSLVQRGKLHAAANDDPVRGQALIVCMGCALFTEDDLDDVMGLSGEVVTILADAVLAVSGLSTEEAEKN